MHKSWAVGLLALLVMATVTQGQVDGNRQTGLELDRSINAIDLAVNAGSFVAVTDDVDAPSADTNAPVWFYWGSDGRNLRQDGAADPASCGQIVTGDCFTDATHVAVDASGDRMVVAGVIDAQSSTVVLIDTIAGPVHEETVTGRVTGVAISDDGTSVAVGTARDLNDDGRVIRYLWTTSVESWLDVTDAPVAAVDISSDGTVITAAAGPDHHRYHRSAAATLVADRNFPGSVTDVQISGTEDHLSIAGSTDGYFVLYADDTTANNRALRVRDANTPITAVAISEAGDFAAIGNGNGRVWLYGINDELNLLANSGLPLGEWDVATAITDLEFSRDGRFLAIAAGDLVAMRAVTLPEAPLLWSEVLPGSIGALRVSADGERLIAAANGDDGHFVYRYEAIHAIDLEVPVRLDAAPGASYGMTAKAINQGNRAEALAWTVEAGANFTAMAPTAANLLPGMNGTYGLTIAVPAHYAPGTYPVWLNATAASGVHDSALIQVVIPAVRAWTLEAGENAVSLGAQSGQETVFQLDLSNDGNVAEAAPINVSVNATGWSARIIGGDLQEPGITGALEVGVTSPADAAEGAAASIQVTLGGRDSIELHATVGARFAVDLDAPAGLEIHPGQPATFMIDVTNSGNAVDGARVTSLAVPGGWALQISGAASHVVSQLSAGETVQIPATITAPASAATGEAPHQVFLRATSLAEPGRDSTATMLVTVTPAPVEEMPEDTAPTPAAGPLFVLALLACATLLRRR